MAEQQKQAEMAATRLIQRTGEDDVLVVQRALLEVAGGPDKDKRLELDRGESIRVGGGPSCDLVLSDPAVSGEHFAISPTNDGFLLRDLESTNGTFLEGIRVGEAYLPATGVIRVGDSTLTFSVADEQLEFPLSKRSRFGGLLGHAESMRQVFHILEKVAKTDATVLIEGESGTGKELAAQALHDQSRRDGAFVPIDCGSIPASLIESELFGHVKGAFTGASTDKIGPFEEAGDGTVFLDEIGELPLDLQPKLLRALETRSIRRVGENTTRSFAGRLVAATNRNLSSEVAAGRFRQDLFFRLSVIRVRLPPLRDRRDEIPRLVSHFLGQLGRDPSERPPAPMMRLLANHSWPGNVRELRNVVERLALLPGMDPDFYIPGAGSEGESQTGAASGGAGQAPALFDLPFHEGKRRWVENFERDYLTARLERSGGNISELARDIGLSRQSCHRLLSRHGIGDQ